MKQGEFSGRHIGPRQEDVKSMLNTIGVSSIDDLISKTIPGNIRLSAPLNISEPLSEFEYHKHLRGLASQNKVVKNYIGMGYHPVILPAVIQRNILENPGWYTAYTPYQAEIAQGRLEALLNFQTMVSDLTGMDLANASLLDEGTAASEAMIMFLHNRSRAQEQANANKCFIDEACLPQTISVVRMRAKYLGVELVIGKIEETTIDATYFAVILQYPDIRGEVRNFADITASAHAVGAKVAVASDLMALAMLQSPGNWGADVVFGNSQRFGVPMGFGGPHAAFFATRDEFKRLLPGRIIGVSKDRHGRTGYRMALQTREQHIRRDKATSNICTAQALLAVMASMYAVYHGPKGIRSISERIHAYTSKLAGAIKSSKLKVENSLAFDTLYVNAGAEIAGIKSRAEQAGVNFYYYPNGSHLSISLNETTSLEDVNEILAVLGITGKVDDYAPVELIPASWVRTDEILAHPVFNTHHSESEMMRYMKKLENRDLSLTHAMIPLGSCTMKLNAAAELLPLTWPEFANMHPFAPANQVAGYLKIAAELEKDLSEVTGFAGVSLQPNSGAQGEYAGLLVIRAYHEARGDNHRDICLIPSSAHGTNPASAVMAGMQVVVVACDNKGNIDIADLKAKAEAHRDKLGALMLTYPSTHGIFEEGVMEVTKIIHDNGGQVYMDGANMNAQVGLTSPGRIGADVCHLNLHKTFAIPHGGGGPGMGPIGVAAHLVDFLPGNPLVKTGGKHAIDAVSAAPFGSALILLISYGYIKMLGSKGLTDSTSYAILNANYIKARLQGKYDILYQGTNGTVAHELIIDCRAFKQDGIEVEDIAKRLMDYGFHAPTVSFPVAGTLMIEPTESEPKEELDRFCDAMLSIREEVREVEQGADKLDNVLKMAPHTCAEVCANEWNHSYSREKAAYPLDYIREAKFWTAVGRVDNAYGDRNLVCSCPPMEAFAEA
jgi:glycine dehydrogenase